MNENLRQKFNLIEMAAFPTWQKSNRKQRKIIVRKIAKLEAVAIIKDTKVEYQKLKINLRFENMVDKIIEKIKLLKEVVGTFKDNGSKKEDEPTLIEAAKVIVKDLSEILNKPEGEE